MTARLNTHINSSTAGVSSFLNMRYTKLLLVTLFATWLSACGGGGGGDSGNSGSAPAPAVVIPAGTTSYPALLEAMQTGDSSLLFDQKAIARHAQYLIQELSQAPAARIEQIFKGVSTAYDPTRLSSWITPIDLATAQPLIVGDKGKTLASLSTSNGGRSVGYGVNVLAKLQANELTDHAPAFKRIVAWLVNGNADTALPASLKVSFAGIDIKKSTAGFMASGIKTETAACDFLVTSACAANADLLVVGGDLQPNNAFTQSIRELIRAGRPVLYVHTKQLMSSDSGTQLLKGMGLQLDYLSGNYWVQDKVAAGRSAETNRTLTDPYRAERGFVNTMIDDSFSMPYDWTGCTIFAGKTSCDDVPNLGSGLMADISNIRDQVDSHTRSGTNIFTSTQNDVLKVILLWADVARNETTYKLDKILTPARFQKALLADSLVPYVRKTAPPQTPLGSFATSKSRDMPVSATDETVLVTLPAEKGFTAIGRMAAPGRAFTIELEDAGAAIVSLRLNTQRSESTRIWDKEKYDRPRYLRSPDISLGKATPIQLNTPYGGTMQLVFDKATAGQTVKLKLRGVAQHPFLDLTAQGGSAAAFAAALNAQNYDWVEIKMPGIEVHALAQKIYDVINNKDYAGNIELYLDELKTVFFEDIYMLAGFKLAGKSLSNGVQAMCTDKAWDCENSDIHRMPGTQHINVDKYAQCGDGCSGNPYDQTSGLNPRGWTESHEVGHNLQNSILNIYADRSTEVSNNLFPLHKGWRLLHENKGDRSKDQVKYKSAFDMIKLGAGTAGTYANIWASSDYAAQGGERLAFYIQWIHYWQDRTSGQGGTAKEKEARGWDIFTLLYLHQRLFNAQTTGTWLANRDKLGYSQYETKPTIDGNDNLLIALSSITGRDQRKTFDLWGVTYSEAAKNQVVFSHPPAKQEVALFYANTTTNNYSTVQRIDMSVADPVWPFK